MGRLKRGLFVIWAFSFFRTEKERDKAADLQGIIPYSKYGYKASSRKQPNTPPRKQEIPFFAATFCHLF